MKGPFYDGKPNNPTDAFGHSGVKGMRWGHRKKDETSSGEGSSGEKRPTETSNAALKKASDSFYSKQNHEKLQSEGQKKLEAQANQSFPTKRQAKAGKLESRSATLEARSADLKKQKDALAPGFRNAYKRGDLQGQINYADKERASLDKKSGQLRDGKLTSNQKLALGVGVGVASGIFAAHIARQIQLNKAGLTTDIQKRIGLENHSKSTEQWQQMFGHDPGFKTAVNHNLTSSGQFYAGLTNKKAYDRPEFVISKDTVFQRLSSHEEDSTEYGKMKGAYSTFLHNDKKLYGSSMEFGSKEFTVSFKPKDDVRVPNMSTVLAHLKQVKQQDNPGLKYSDEQIAATYHQMSGGGWDSKTSLKLFSSLKQFGYSAIVDDMDAGYLGDLPVVFFGDAHPATSTPRTSKDQLTDSIGVLSLTRQHA